MQTALFDLHMSQRCSLFDLRTSQRCSLFDLCASQRCSLFDLRTSQRCSLFDLRTSQRCSLFDLHTTQRCSLFDLHTTQRCSLFDLRVSQRCCSCSNCSLMYMQQVTDSSDVHLAVEAAYSGLKEVVGSLNPSQKRRLSNYLIGDSVNGVSTTDECDCMNN